jgi:hypothetical protein
MARALFFLRQVRKWRGVRAQLWTAVAERSGDTAFYCRCVEGCYYRKSFNSAVAAPLCRRSPKKGGGSYNRQSLQAQQFSVISVFCLVSGFNL